MNSIYSAALEIIGMTCQNVGIAAIWISKNITAHHFLINISIF